jgi:hypothetical protein
MMRDVDLHGQQNFSPGEPPIGRIVRLADLLLGQAWDHRRAIGNESFRNLTMASLSVVLGNAGGSESFKPAQN